MDSGQRKFAYKLPTHVAIDRIGWLYKHRNLVKGLKLVSEPPVLRFFFGKLQTLDNRGADLHIQERDGQRLGSLVIFTWSRS